METILCAAIWYKELPLKSEEVTLTVQRLPTNCDKGIVLCGHRHLQCMRTMNSIYGLTDFEAGESVQGFLTNKNRFVNRTEGGRIAYAAGQIEKEKYLFSEDLY